MKKKSTAKDSAMLSGGGYCDYYCSHGQWVLSGNFADSGYYCPNTMSGGCVGGRQTTIPAIPLGATVAVAAKLPKNSGEYVFHRGQKTVRLVRGECGDGRVLPPEISVRDLGEIAPKAASLIKAVAKSKDFTAIHVVVAAQKTSRK